MDIDIIEEAQAAGVSPQSVRKPIIALVDDAHPFDLEGYISNYTGNFAFNFLGFIQPYVAQSNAFKLTEFDM